MRFTVPSRKINSRHLVEINLPLPLALANEQMPAVVTHIIILGCYPVIYICHTVIQNSTFHISLAHVFTAFFLKNRSLEMTHPVEDTFYHVQGPGHHMEATQKRHIGQSAVQLAECTLSNTKTMQGPGFTVSILLPAGMVHALGVMK